MKDIKKSSKAAEDLVLDTRGAEMPDPSRKLSLKASDAAKVFENTKGANGAKKSGDIKKK